MPLHYRDELSLPKAKKAKLHHPKSMESLRESSSCQDIIENPAPANPNLKSGLSINADQRDAEPTVASYKPAVAEPAIPDSAVIESVLADYESTIPDCVVPRPVLADYETVVAEPMVFDCGSKVTKTMIAEYEPTVADPTLHDCVAPESLVADSEFIVADYKSTVAETTVSDHATPVPVLAGYEPTVADPTLPDCVAPESLVTDRELAVAKGSITEVDVPKFHSSERADLFIEEYFDYESCKIVATSQYATPQDGESPVLIKKRQRKNQDKSYQLKLVSSRELLGLLPLPREVATPYKLRRTLPENSPSKKRRISASIPVEGGPSNAASLTRAIATPYTLRENSRSNQNAEASNASHDLIHPRAPQSAPRQGSHRRRQTKPPPPKD
ncbi:hypothetical protein L0F63_002006 [Massospora cicadina]|nr:hypothetical protein L0F63_002006 [Massospora cicadina]